MASGNSFPNPLRFQQMTKTFFLADLKGDANRANDFNGWQIDANVARNWPAHGGKAGTMDGTVGVLFMDGHAEAVPKKNIPTDWRDIFWQPPL